jgi:hypothetical protein
MMSKAQVGNMACTSAQVMLAPLCRLSNSQCRPKKILIRCRRISCIHNQSNLSSYQWSSNISHPSMFVSHASSDTMPFAEAAKQAQETLQPRQGRGGASSFGGENAACCCWCRKERSRLSANESPETLLLRDLPRKVSILLFAASEIVLARQQRHFQVRNVRNRVMFPDLHVF